MPFLREDEAPTQAEREKMPAHLFGLPQEKKYPLDTPEHVRAAASYSAKEHSAGRLSDEKFAEIQRHLAVAKKKHGIGEEGKEDRADSHARVMHLDLASGGISSHRRTQQGGLVAKANLTRTGVFKYQQPDGSVRRELRLPEEVFDKDSLDSLAHATVTVDHPNRVTPSNWRKVAVGHVVGRPTRDGRFAASDIAVQDGDAMDRVEKGDLQELSCGYECSLEAKAGSYNGEPYDAIQRQIRYNHVALGPKGWGRAGPEVRLHLDSGASVSDQSMDRAGYVASMPDGDSQPNTDLQARFDALKAENDTLKSQAQARTDAAAELAQAKTAIERLTGEVAALKSVRDAADKPRQEAAEVERFDAEVEKRVAIVEAGRRVLGKKWDHKGKSKSVIQREILANKAPQLKIDGWSDDAVEGAYLSILESASRATRSFNDLADLTSPRADRRMPHAEDEEEEDPNKVGTKGATQDAYDAMIKRDTEAYKRTPSRRDRRRMTDSNANRSH